jgi:uroporphyrin-3 C-methyltransferase
VPWRWILVLLVLFVLAGLGWWQWQRMQHSEQRANAWEGTSQRLEERIADLETDLENTRRTQRSLDTRASDNAATNRVLREELLGMGERATVLEEAVARLAETRLRGEMILRLNETEFLLLLGEERLRLFGDPAAAMQAFALADSALAGLNDPVLATLRQTLAQELAALRQMPADVRPAMRAELARLADEVARLPATRAGEVATTDANDSRLMRLLSQLVTIRRLDQRDALLGPAQREAALAGLKLQLELAQAALARPDPAAFAHALNQASVGVARLFDSTDADVVRLQAALARLRDTPLVTELPVLGATLRELRGLRAARNAAEQLPGERFAPDVATSAPSAPPADAPEASPDATPEATPEADE